MKEILPIIDFTTNPMYQAIRDMLEDGWKEAVKNNKDEFYIEKKDYDFIDTLIGTPSGGFMYKGIKVNYK